MFRLINNHSGNILGTIYSQTNLAHSSREREISPCGCEVSIPHSGHFQNLKNDGLSNYVALAHFHHKLLLLT